MLWPSWDASVSTAFLKKGCNFCVAAPDEHTLDRGAGAVRQQEGGHRHLPWGPHRGEGPQRQLSHVQARQLLRHCEWGQCPLRIGHCVLWMLSNDAYSRLNCSEIETKKQKNILQDSASEEIRSGWLSSRITGIHFAAKKIWFVCNNDWNIGIFDHRGQFNARIHIYAY